LTCLTVACAAIAALRIGVLFSGSWLAAFVDVLALPISAAVLLLPLSIVWQVRWERRRPPRAASTRILRILIGVSIPIVFWFASSGVIWRLDRSDRLEWTISDATMFARYSERKSEFDALGKEIRERLTNGNGSDESLAESVQAIGIRVVAVDLKASVAYLTVARNSTLSTTRVKGFAYSIDAPNRVVESDTDSLRFRRSDPPTFRRIDGHWYIFIGAGSW
jgi:hypothetical protein